MRKPLKIEDASLEVLISLKQEMENELEVLQDQIVKVENEIYYRENPELRPDKEAAQ